MDRIESLALVESATQLLNVLEWAHAQQAIAGLRVAVLAPPPHDIQTRRQLGRVGQLARQAGIDVRHLDIRARSLTMLGGTRDLVRDLPRASRLILGDPFSGLIQATLPLARAGEVVVVDDGTATWEFRRCVNAGTPLVRWQLPPGRRAERARRATRLLSPSESRGLTVFSSLAGSVPVGATGIPNEYAWTRQWRRPRIVPGAVDIVGTSLVDSGVVERVDYLAAVERLARRAGSVRYLAHRRESANRLAEIAALPGVQVVRSQLPVELELRTGPVAERVITFPSTAAHTLPVVLGDLDVNLEVRHIDPAWFTRDTTSHAREFVTRIATDAPLRPVLELA
jgi:hypothetical protein